MQINCQYFSFNTKLKRSMKNILFFEKILKKLLTNDGK